MWEEDYNMMCVLFMYNRFNHIGGVIIFVLASKAMVVVSDPDL